MSRIALLAGVTLLAACGGGSSSTEGGGTGWLRVANLSLDLGPIDFCLAPAGTTAFTGPVLAAAGSPGGMVYGGAGELQVSRHFSFPSGSYDVRVVAAGAGAACTTPLLALPGVSLAAGTRRLVAALGVASAPAAAHTLAAFVDETTGEATRVTFRFVNASLFVGNPPVPAPDLDVGVTSASVFAIVFAGVPYGGKAPPSAIVDANGYARVDPAILAAGAQLTVCVSGSTPPSPFCRLKAVPASGIGAGAVASVYAVGVAASPPNSLLCNDDQAPASATPNHSRCALQ
jgi:hypothetical protein